ncbi:DUF5337 domain-containing protein [Limimaricola pyoseonensis]|uniref:Uncharacterized protein n=1 Tax=Limimaricola pyoseonensis TaxID=521013 RepID=A0A1G6ZE03_9RHOB|nr:DUF5337 domain-containing protein [Limimaricola pyoseonensis]SDE00849.1 hypothetical protein SAMN04488567_0500 [Limimaricola pyoseonensis]
MSREGARGRRAALVLAGTGVFWIAATAAGILLDLPQRWRGLFDLMALAGFVMGLWMTYQTWRARQDDER